MEYAQHIDNTLDTIVLDRITDKLAKVFKVKTGNQRIDSVHIKSNMRRLGRIGIFTSSINKFLVNLERGYKELFETIDKGILDKYFSEKSLQKVQIRYFWGKIYGILGKNIR